jgi:hypothetical protein
MISSSDRHALEWRSGLGVPGIDGLDLKHAYKPIAWLGAVDGRSRSTAEVLDLLAPRLSEIFTADIPRRHRVRADRRRFARRLQQAPVGMFRAHGRQ